MGEILPPDPPIDATHGPTLAQLVAGPLPDAVLPRLLRLFAEGAFYTAFGMLLALGWGVPAAGVLSIFLSAAALQPRFHELLDENRRLIWERAAGGTTANWITIRSLLAAFLGVFVAYLAIAAVTGAPRIVELLGPALSLGGQDRAGHLHWSFGALVGQRISLVVAFFGVAFVYRSYAALVGLAWSASLWGATPVLIGGGAAGTAAATAALVVPALLDASGLVLSCLAAIYASKGLVKYPVTDPRAVRVLSASALLLAIAVTLGALGALLEVGVATPLLQGLVGR